MVVNVIILQTTNQSNLSIKKLVVKVNDIVLFISFSLLTFSYFNRLIREIFAHLWQMLIKNHWQILEKIYKRKKGIPVAYKIDKIDVDSYFFYNFLYMFTKSNRIIRFSKGLEYATFSIKKFEYEELIAKQSFDLSSDLQIRIVVHFEVRPRHIGAVQKYSTNKLFSSPRPNNNNFLTTEFFVLPLLQRLQCSGSTD